MAIDFSTLFTQLGTLLAYQYDVDVYGNTTAPTDVANIIAQYPEAWIDGIQSQLQGTQASILGITSYFTQLATTTINNTVYADNPLSSNTNLSLSMAEVIRQMIAQSQTVQSYTIGSSVSATNVTNGNGTVAVSTTASNGLIQQEVFAENIRLTCSVDSSMSPAIAGSERFQALGELAQSNQLAANWPLGSGCQTNLTAIDATITGLNLLNNSDFENFTSNTPNLWTVVTGTPGTQILKATSPIYTGAACLEYAGDGSTHTEITQVVTLQSQTVYQFAVWLQVSAVPAAGVLTVRLVDGGGSVIDDTQGNANAVTISLPGVTTSWVAHTGTFRTPYIMPGTVKLSLELSTALSNSKNLFIDHLSLGAATQLYTGGPWVSIFSGSDDYYIPDFYVVTPTNSRPSNLKSFQAGADRLLNLRQLGFQLPYAGSPTISDSLI